jgi:hypothetical protein
MSLLNLSKIEVDLSVCAHSQGHDDDDDDDPPTILNIHDLLVLHDA